MNYKKYELSGYNLHVIKTKSEKFKTISVQANFKRIVKKEELTVRNLISSLLVKTTNKYKTNRELCIALEDLYELNFTSEPVVSGNYAILSFDTRFLNEKYTEKGMNKKSLNLFLDILTDPNIKDQAFNQEQFLISKKSIKNDLELAKDNARSYSTQRLLEEMANGSSYGFDSDGYLEDLEKLDSKNTYDYYQSMLENDLIDIYVIGDVDSEEIQTIFKQKLKLKLREKITLTHFVEHDLFRNEENVIVETKKYEQSNLSIGFKIDNLTMFERQYVLPIYNFIFGGGPDSKLFQTIREKNSLCYTVGSNIKPVTSLLIVRAGIDRKNYEKTLKLVKKLFLEMNKGKFTDDDVLVAINNYQVSIKEMLDNQKAIISSHISEDCLGYDSIEKRAKNITKVNKKDLVALGQKIKLDTVYLLEGVMNENN